MGGKQAREKGLNIMTVKETPIQSPGGQHYTSTRTAPVLKTLTMAGVSEDMGEPGLCTLLVEI